MYNPVGGHQSRLSNSESTEPVAGSAGVGFFSGLPNGSKLPVNLFSAKGGLVPSSSEESSRASSVDSAGGVTPPMSKSGMKWPHAGGTWSDKGS